MASDNRDFMDNRRGSFTFTVDGCIRTAITVQFVSSAGTTHIIVHTSALPNRSSTFWTKILSAKDICATCWTFCFRVAYIYHDLFVTEGTVYQAVVWTSNMIFGYGSITSAISYKITFYPICFSKIGYFASGRHLSVANTLVGPDSPIKVGDDTNPRMPVRSDRAVILHCFPC